MNNRKKTLITSLIFTAAVFSLVLLAINPIFGQIKDESNNFIVQKKQRLESEAKVRNIRNFMDGLKQRQSDFEKFDKLFINISEPIGFIEFLEDEAKASRLSLVIAPPALKPSDGNLGQSFEFGLSLKGSLPDFLRFLERLEYAPYIISPANLTIGENANEKKGIVATLSIKVYAR